MGQLQRDIEAVISIATAWEGVPATIGTIETPHDWQLVRLNNSQRNIDDISRMFSSYLRLRPDSRIAFAFVEHGQYPISYSWPRAARDLCEEDIAGVLLLYPANFHAKIEEGRHPEIQHALDTINDPASYALFTLSLLPQEFREAGLPILYDGTGCIEEFCPASKMIDTQGRLTFTDPAGNFPKGHVLVSTGKCEKGAYPVFNATGTGQQEAAKKLVVCHTAKQVAKISQQALSSIGFHVPYDLSFKEVFKIADGAFPGIADPDILDIEKTLTPDLMFLESNEYAITIEEDAVSDLDEIREKIRDVGRVFAIARMICRDAGAKPEKHHLCIGNDDRIAAFKQACEESGAASAIEAFAAGVPIEDIIA